MGFVEKQRLLDQVNALENTFDDLIIDTAPGIDENVLYLSSAAQEILVVVSPDPASLTDAYALIKVLNQRYRESRFSIVANMVRDEQEAQVRIRQTLRRCFQVPLREPGLSRVCSDGSQFETGE